MKVMKQGQLGNGNYYRLGVFAVGTKKRCRKVDRHLFHIGHINLDYDEQAAIELAKNTLIKNMRDTRSAEIHLDLIEIKDDSLLWQPFDDTHKRINLI